MIEQLDFSGFSCPQIGIEKNVLDFILGSHANEVIKELYNRHSNDIKNYAPGTCDVFTNWMGRTTEDDYDTVWNTAFGDAHALLLSAPNNDLIRCATALALRVSESGFPGEWEAQLPKEEYFRFDRWVLPQVKAIKVKSTPTAVYIQANIKNEWYSIDFNRNNDYEWVFKSTIKTSSFEFCKKLGFRFCFASGNGISAPASSRLLSADAYHFDRNDISIDSTWISTCHNAVSLIAETSEIYTTWVGRVLKNLIALKAKPSIFNSGSDKFSPGVICVSNHPYQWPLAEILVHEATHQYLHILTRLGAIDDGSDSNLYYSPFRNKERPIFFIVVAYHAFANVLLFYKTARKRGLVPENLGCTDAFTNREETLEKQLRMIEGPLMQSRALTALGQSLWKPLYRVLRQQ